MAKTSVPCYTHHKPTGQARVRINGKDHWLGKHGSPESLERYAEKLLEWQQATRVEASKLKITFGELALLYRKHAENRYVKRGKPTSELSLVKYALKWMNQVARRVPLAEIRPGHLKAARERMIQAGLTRGTVNKFTQRMRRAITWAVGEELCAATVLLGLQAVKDLESGRSPAPDRPPVLPVPEAFVEAVKGHLNPAMWGAVCFQRATGARPGEALSVRACDLDMSGDIWIYTPESHKTEHHNKARKICIGPEGQAVLREHLCTDLGAYLFGTARSERQQPYRRDSYTNAIAKACKAAKVPRWSPNQLRHNFATRARREFGIEAARVTLGHSSAVTSEIYAERDLEAAKAVVAKIG